MTQEIDLSAYPVVRIDQISLLDDVLLEKIDLEVNTLLSANDNSNVGLRKYLNKQANAMADEIARRKASDRVQKLLSGAQDLLAVNYSPIPTPREAETSKTKDQLKQPIVELKIFESVRPSLQLESSILPATTNAPISSATSLYTVKEEPTVLTSDVSLDISAATMNNESTPRSIHTARSTSSNHSYGTTTGGKTRRISSYQQQQQQDESNLPSKKSLEIINKNFGNEFIVAATEKKKRFFPQKKDNDVNTEEAKRKERLERRKFAMERLAKRREKQDELKAKLREIKRLEKVMVSKQQQSIAVATAISVSHDSADDSADDSDSSQSVSSDDGHHLNNDNALVIIDESMIQVVQKAVTAEQQQQQKAFPVVARKSEQPAVATVAKAAPAAAGLTLPQPPAAYSKKVTIVAGVGGSALPSPSHSKAVIATSSNKINNSKRNGSKAALLPASSSLIKQKAAVAATNTNPNSSSSNCSSSTKVLPPFPVTDTTAVSNSNVAEGEFEEKNLSALATIRRLKEMRNNSQQQSTASLLSIAVSAVEEDLPLLSLATAADDSSNDNHYDSQTQPALVQEGKANDPAATDTNDSGDFLLLVVELPATSNDNGDDDGHQVTSVDLMSECDKYENVTQNNSSPALVNDDSNDEQQQQQQSSSSPLTIFELMLYLNTNNYSYHTATTNHTTTTSIGIFQLIQDTIMFNYSLHDFPGLHSLISNTTTGGFTVDIEVYQQQQAYNEKNTIQFTQLSLQRYSVSFGLIILVETCQALLLGLLQSINSSVELLQALMNVLERFDSMAMIHQQLEDDVCNKVYLAQVSVCGNGYQVCEKLHRILQWHYRSSVTMGKEGESMSRCLSRAGGFRPQQQQASSSSSTNIMTAADVQSSLDTVDSIDNSAAHKENKSPRPSVYPYRTTVTTTTLTQEQQDRQQQQREEEIAAADDAIADAQMALLETLDRLGLNTGKSAPSTASATASGVGSCKNNSRRPSRRQQQQQQHHPSSSNSTTTAAAADNSSSNKQQSSDDYRLTDIYPHFAMIFPMAYNISSSRNKGGSDDMTYARSLLETMAVQAAVYEEWIDVMKDYSTVFCYNNNNNNDDSDASVGRERSKEVYHGTNHALHYRIKSSRPEVTNIVADVFHNILTHWEELPPGLGLGLSWNLLWTWSKPRINTHHLLIWQRVNHFEESRQLTRKDLLKRNLQRFTDLSHSLAKEFEIMPTTFLLPHEYTAFITAFTSSAADNKNKNYWILKPVGLSRGRGISLIKDLGDLTYSQASVVQRYLERPLCLNGFKFDLRLFVLATSFQPLEAFIYREGFARVSLEQYSLHVNDVDNKFIHLTNSSIQRHHVTGPGKGNPLAERMNDVDVGGSKISLLGDNGLWNRLFRQGVDVAALWSRIIVLIVKSLVAVMVKIPNQPCAFELFGYDVLIDDELKPWLLEVNASPSLSRDNALDCRVKNALIADIIRLLDVAPYDRAALARVMRRRLNGIAKNRFVHGRNDVDLEQDLRDILGDYRPRQIGELPKEMGQFERLCPDTPAMALVMKLKKKLIRE